MFSVAFSGNGTSSRRDASDVPHCIRQRLSLARAEDEECAGDVAPLAASASASDREGADAASRSRSRSQRGSGRVRARLRPNVASSGAASSHSRDPLLLPRGPPAPQPATFVEGMAGTDGEERASPRSARSSDSSEIERRMELRDRAGTPAWALGSRRERADRLDRDCSSRRCGANPLDAFLRETESGEEEQPEEDPLESGSSGDEVPPDRAPTHVEDSQTHASSAHDTGNAETEFSSSPSWPSFDQEDDGLGHEPQSKD